MSGLTGGAGNGAAPQATCGSQAGVLRNATQMAWSGPSPLLNSNRANALPYTARHASRVAWSVVHTALIVAVSFVAMEPVTYLAHRFVMHGVGWVLHRSHHLPAASGFEANDAFPVIFAAITILAMAAGASLPAVHPVEVVGVGVTLYGLAYMFVHDVYIHARLGRMPRSILLERLKDAHAIHHLYGGEPFGMLVPIVPRRLRERAACASFDPSTRRARRVARAPV